jgi:hypothetical protein
VYVETHASDPKLPADLAKRAKAVRPRLGNQIRPVLGRANVGWNAEVENLYRVATDIQTALQAP